MLLSQPSWMKALSCCNWLSVSVPAWKSFLRGSKAGKLLRTTWTASCLWEFVDAKMQTRCSHFAQSHQQSVIFAEGTPCNCFTCAKVHQFIDDTPCKDFDSNETNYVDWHQPESHSSQQGQKTVKLGWLKECLWLVYRHCQLLDPTENS